MTAGSSSGTGEAAAALSSNYNTIYQRVVQSPEDIVGLIAYSLYKQNKKNWIERFHARNSATPTPSEVAAHVDGYSDADLQRLRSQAEMMMVAFSESIVEQRTPDIQAAILSERLARAGAFWPNVMVNLVATLFAGLIAIGALGILVYAPTFADLGKRLVEYITPQGKPQN